MKPEDDSIYEALNVLEDKQGNDDLKPEYQGWDKIEGHIGTAGVR